MEQYRKHLVTHSRNTVDTKLKWVEQTKVRSLAQLVFWSRKTQDLVEQTNSIRQRVAVKGKIENTMSGVKSKGTSSGKGEARGGKRTVPLVRSPFPRRN